MSTPNLSLNTPANGSNVGNWDVPVNANWNIIDSAIAGGTIINAAAQSGVVAITLAQYQTRFLIFEGTPSANVNYQFPNGIAGIWYILNATNGALSLTISSAGGGTSVVVPQTYATIVTCDGANIRFATTYFNGTGQDLTGTAAGLSIGGNAATATSATSAGTATYASTVTGTSYAIGYKQIPQDVQTSSYAAATTDVGKHIFTNSGVTVNNGVFAAGDNFLVVNNSGSAITLTQGGSAVLRLAGTSTTGSRTIAAYGQAGVLCVGGDVFSITGAGVS